MVKVLGGGNKGKALYIPKQCVISNAKEVRKRPYGRKVGFQHRHNKRSQEKFSIKKK